MVALLNGHWLLEADFALPTALRLDAAIAMRASRGSLLAMEFAHIYPYHRQMKPLPRRSPAMALPQEFVRIR